jgi:hypothetical protein
MPAASSCPAWVAAPKRPETEAFWVANRLLRTTHRTNVPKWEEAPAGVGKLLSKTSLSVYFVEENSFVAFRTLSHCSETEKPLTPVILPAYSGL